MAHLQERKEKICLNCGAELIDRYCQKCGQENVEPKENFLHLTKHFLEDVTHFDGKFFSTIRYLVTKPGFLTEEYIKGRRASYINPIRLYLFISALFFLLLMSIFIKNDEHSAIKFTESNKKDRTISKVGTTQKDSIEFTKDSTELDQLKANDTNIANALKTVNLKRGDTTITITEGKGFAPEQTVEEYDSVQNSYKPQLRDGWFRHYFTRKMIASRAASHKNGEEWVHQFKERFFHSIPYVLFISLPLIALLLRLLYIRRKQFFYVSHIIFLLHYYCFVFVSMLLANTLEMCGSVGNIIAALLNIGLAIYLFMAMKRFYKQGWFKTFVKFFLLLFIGMFILTILLIIFALNSFLNIS